MNQYVRRLKDNQTFLVLCANHIPHVLLLVFDKQCDLTSDYSHEVLMRLAQVLHISSES